MLSQAGRAGMTVEADLSRIRNGLATQGAPRRATASKFSQPKQTSNVFMKYEPTSTEMEMRNNYRSNTGGGSGNYDIKAMAQSSVSQQ